MAYFNFARWDQVPQAKPFYLDQNPNLAGSNCAPQVFYFRPQKMRTNGSMRRRCWPEFFGRRPARRS